MKITPGIEIHFIKHTDQRYVTVGDYKRDKDGKLHIWVSEMEDIRYNYLVAVHELVEALTTELRDIKEEDISAFDIHFEEERELGIHTPTEEPGDSEEAPYKKEHFLATNIERILSAEWNVNWNIYDKTVNDL